jgi:hypothetical protein
MAVDATGAGGIRGRVTTESGEPVVGTPVMIGGDSPSHPDIAAVTGPTGEYEFVGLVPGDYEVLANPESGLLVRRGRVAPGEVTELHFVTTGG